MPLNINVGVFISYDNIVERILTVGGDNCYRLTVLGGYPLLVVERDRVQYYNIFGLVYILKYILLRLYRIRVRDDYVVQLSDIDDYPPLFGTVGLRLLYDEYGKGEWYVLRRSGRLTFYNELVDRFPYEYSVLFFK